MQPSRMETGGYVLDKVQLRAKLAEDVDPGFSLIQRYGGLLDGQEEGGPQGQPQDASQLSKDQLSLLWTPWQRPGPRGVDYQLAIVDAEKQLFRGSLVVRWSEGALTADLGYWVDPAHWGQGLGSGALRLASWWAFSVLGAQELTACVQPGNGRSRSLLEKLGFMGLGPIPGLAGNLLAYHLPRFVWSQREGAFTPGKP